MKPHQALIRSEVEVVSCNFNQKVQKKLKCGTLIHLLPPESNPPCVSLPHQLSNLVPSLQNSPDRSHISCFISLPTRPTTWSSQRASDVSSSEEVGRTFSRESPPRWALVKWWKCEVKKFTFRLRGLWGERRVWSWRVFTSEGFKWHLCCCRLRVDVGGRIFMF